MLDYRVKATTAGGSIRAIATRTTHTARAIQSVQQASPVAAAALGRLATAAVLLAADFKTDFRLMVEVDGQGPLGRTVAEIRTGGLVRARARHPGIDLPLRADGKLAVGQAVGCPGVLRVVREEAGQAPYEGRTPLISGEIGQDLTAYYVQSEQVPSAVALGVLVDRDTTVAAAGGIVVQALPGSDGRTEEIAARFEQLHNLSLRLSLGDTPEDLLRYVLPGPIHWFEREPIQYQCQCSLEHSIAIIESLPKEELESLLLEQGAEVVCHYCNTAYPISAAVLHRATQISEH